jgi:hypothetical protein
MGDQKNQNPNYGSEQGRKDEEQKSQNERARQRSDQEQPGKRSGGQSGDRDRASNPRAKAERSVTGSPNLASRISKTSIGR